MCVCVCVKTAPPSPVELQVFEGFNLKEETFLLLLHVLSQIPPYLSSECGYWNGSRPGLGTNVSWSGIREGRVYFQKKKEKKMKGGDFIKADSDSQRSVCLQL